MLTRELRPPSRISRQQRRRINRSPVVPHRALWFAGFLAVAGQRISLPLGGIEIPLSTIGLIFLFASLMLLFRWTVSAPGLAAWGLLLIAGALSYARNSVTNSGQTSTSLLIFLAVYLPLLLLPGRDGLRGAGNVLWSGIFSAIKVGCVLALVQVVTQLAGLGFWDPLYHLPSSVQTEGFNAHYPTTYINYAFGLDFKPNGMIFLEPSFLSLFSSIGLVWIAHDTFAASRPSIPPRRALMWTMVLAAGLATSISASGIPVLAFGALPLVLKVLRRPVYLMAMVALAAAAYFNGLFDPLIRKATEGTGSNTSTGLRIVAPYKLLPPYWYERFVFGHGPGTAEGIINHIGVQSLSATTVMKLALEYGLIGVAALACGLALTLTRVGQAPPSLILAALAAWLIPSEALLNSMLAAWLFFVLPHWDGDEPDERPPVPDDGQTQRGSAEALGILTKEQSSI